MPLGPTVAQVVVIGEKGSEEGVVELSSDGENDNHNIHLGVQ